MLKTSKSTMLSPTAGTSFRGCRLSLFDLLKYLLSHLGGMRTGLLIIICWFPTTSANRCDASYSIQDRVLKNHTIAIRPAERIEECALLCVDYPDCHSINFYQKHKICDLNDKTHTSHPKDMISSALSNYMENILRPYLCNQDSECGSGLHCSPLEKKCVCHRRTTSGKYCAIPFQYNGVTYNCCSNVNHGRLWCSLDPIYASRWENCQV